MMYGRWYRVFTKTPDLATGSILAQILNLLSKELPVKGVRLADIDGMGESLPRITSNEGLFFPPDTLIDICKDMSQFIWGDFFLLESESIEILTSNSIQESIAKTLASVRAIDGKDYEIFVKDKSLARRISNDFSRSKIEEGTLDDFDYPR